MTTIETHPEGVDERPTDDVRSRLRLRWWKEVLYVLVFYVVYSAVRNTFGSAGASGKSMATALDHALDIIEAQKAIGLWFEPELQRWYLDLPGRGAIRAWNIYYGTAHFLVTIATLVLLFRKDPRRYPRWRNTLAAMTAAALIGYAGYALMPPRLLDDASIFGACHKQGENCNGYGIEDTLAVDGGLWSFDSGGAMAKVSNQYAAMPSMHTGWSTWCAFALMPMVRRRWARALLLLYPAATVFCILITGNHYWLDAVGGWVALGVGWLIGSRLAAWQAARRGVSDRLPELSPAS